jgi:hypothetical protein
MVAVAAVDGERAIERTDDDERILAVGVRRGMTGTTEKSPHKVMPDK